MSAIRAALLALVLVGAPSAAWADDDHDRVRAMVESGEVLPLPAILEIVAREAPGEVIEVDLDEDDGDVIYEIEVLTPRGRVLEIEIDARTGEILEIEED